MAQMGLSGVRDVFDCEHNVLQALSREPHPEEMAADLGSLFYVTETAIKPYSVGYPIQAPLDAFLRLQREHGLSVDNVKNIVVRLPEDGARVVNDRSMPDVNCQHIIAVALVKGRVSFEDSHSYEQMKDPQIRAVKERVRLIPDPALMDRAAPRSVLLEALAVVLRREPAIRLHGLERALLSSRELLRPEVCRSRLPGLPGLLRREHRERRAAHAARLGLL